MNSLIERIKVWFAMRKADRELTRAIVKALKLYEDHNKRYYVLPDTHHKLRVFSWSELKQMKKQGLFSAHCKEPDFIRESFYFTPSRIDGEFLSSTLQKRKRDMWHEYYKLYRMTKGR